MNKEQIIAHIDAEIARLSAARNALTGGHRNGLKSRGTRRAECPTLDVDERSLKMIDFVLY